MVSFLQTLKGGDRRSIGRANEVVSQVLREPALFEELLSGILNVDPIVRMRCADAVEKISARHPEYLRPYKRKILRQVSAIDQAEVRWHVAQILPRLNLTTRERAFAVQLLLDYLQDSSRIVKTFSMQSLADFAEQDDRFLGKVLSGLEALTVTGSPAMRARGRRLLRTLKR